MSIGPWQIVLILVIVLLIFGTKKLGNIGTDLSKAIRDFKKGMNEDDKKKEAADAQARNTQADDTPGASGSDAPGASAGPPESGNDASSHKPSDRH